MDPIIIIFFKEREREKDKADYVTTPYKEFHHLFIIIRSLSLTSLIFVINGTVFKGMSTLLQVNFHSESQDFYAFD